MTTTNTSEHVTRFSDSSLYDEVCIKCGRTDRKGPIVGPCPRATEASSPFGFSEDDMERDRR